MPSKNIFVNLPVKDLSASMDFFKQLGFSFNPDFTDDTAACMVIGDHIYSMLLTEKRFSDFTDLPISKAKQSTEVLIAIDQPLKEAVDKLVKTAIAAGGKIYSEPQDHGWIYQHAFADLDGYKWEILWMNAEK
jgi:uncharacterized protein